MYKAFNITKSENLENDIKFFFAKSNYVDAGKYIYGELKKGIDSNFKKFRNSDGTLDGTRLTTDWFPIIKADVFISHSHKDIETALKIAGLLYKTQSIICFIDSCIWGYADDLLKAIDDEYCKNLDGRSYSYEKRNYSTSHVHVMLSVALTKMIYNTECLFFLNTPNSVYPKDVILGEKKENKTLSPWIHTEIEMTKLIGTRSANDHRSSQTNFSKLQENFNVSLSIDTSHMENLTYSQLSEWASKTYKDKYDALDHLYKMNNTRSKIYE